MVLTSTLDQARTMGQRAAQAFRITGVPTPNPFPQATQPELAQAWRDAYLKSLK